MGIGAWAKKRKGELRKQGSNMERNDQKSDRKWWTNKMTGKKLGRKEPIQK